MSVAPYYWERTLSWVMMERAKAVRFNFARGIAAGPEKLSNLDTPYFFPPPMFRVSTLAHQCGGLSRMRLPEPLNRFVGSDSESHYAQVQLIRAATLALDREVLPVTFTGRYLQVLE